MLSLCTINFPTLLTRTQKVAITYDSSVCRDGDIIFRRGVSVVSRLVLATDNQSPFSHVGLIKVIDGNPSVVHAVPGESLGEEGAVKIDSLDTFLRADEASGAALFRLREDPHHCAEKAADEAASYAASRIPFDSDFDLNTPDKLYCTELVWRAYKEVGIDLVDNSFDELSIPLRKGQYLLPSTLLKSHWLRHVPIFQVDRVK